MISEDIEVQRRSKLKKEELDKLAYYYQKSIRKQKEIKSIHLKNNEIKNYIDPGVGTMALSVLISIFSCVVFGGQLLYLKIRRYFNKNNNEINNDKDIVIYSEGKQYWNVFESLLDKFEKNHKNVIFYTSDEKDPAFSKKYNYVDCEYIGKPSIAYIKLSIMSANICIMTTPGLNVLQLRRSKNVKHYCHIIHSIGSLLTYRLYSLDYYDSVMCASELQVNELRELEKIRNTNKKEIIVAGCTYLDQLNYIKPEYESSNTILVAPSWGENSLLNRYGKRLIDSLKCLSENVIIRPHPQSLISEKVKIKELIEYTKNSNIIWDFDSNNLESLHKSDILISDFSSIIYDYLFLYQRPFIYSISNFNKYIYDASDVENPPFDFDILSKLGTELTDENIADLPQLISESKNNFNPEKVETIKNTMWKHQNNASKNIVYYTSLKNEEIKLNR